MSLFQSFVSVIPCPFPSFSRNEQARAIKLAVVRNLTGFCTQQLVLMT